MKQTIVAAVFFHWALSSAIWADEQATRAILAVTPRDMAGCVIIEDLAGYCRRIGNSPFWNRVNGLPIVQSVLGRPEVQGTLAMRALLPAVVGVQFDELRDQVLGSSVVLAFRPSKTAGDADAGIAYCHIADASVRKRLWDALTRPGGSRKVESRQRRGIDYVCRTEGGKREYLVQLGPVLGLTDRELLIHASIDAKADGGGLLDSSAVAAAQKHLPAGCLARVLFDPRAFDAAVIKATSQGKSPLERETGASVLASWKSIEWAALSLHIDDRVEFGCHASLNLSALPSEIRGWLDQTPQPAEVWKIAPANALLAATCEIDFADLGRTIEAMAKASPEPETKALLDALAQWIPGHDLLSQVLPRMGPEACAIVMPPNGKRSGVRGLGAKLSAGAAPAELANWHPNVVACIRMSGGDPASAIAAGQIPLHEAIEYGLRPLLVLAGVEYNRKTGDTIRAEVSMAGIQRIHALAGSKHLPVWLEPAFCTTRDWLVLGSSAIAVRELLATANPPLGDSPRFKNLVAKLPNGFSMTLYVNFQQLSESLAGVEYAALNRLGAAIPKNGPPLLPRSKSIVGLFDTMAAGTTHEGSVHHWTVVLFPAPDARLR